MAPIGPKCFRTFSAVVLGIAALITSLQARKVQNDNPATANPAKIPAKIKINLDQAIEVTLPQAHHDLTPVAFKTTKGEEGWIVRVPGGRPIATPAYADGMLFVGGGYGSHELYAFNANTGDLVWKINTGDDGPTAPRTTRVHSRFLSDDPEVLRLVNDGYESFVQRTAQRMMRESKQEIVFNRCPKCGELARTPTAKQCRFCGHDWH